MSDLYNYFKRGANPDTSIEARFEVVEDTISKLDQYYGDNVVSNKTFEILK
jgi:hypothetical protein